MNAHEKFARRQVERIHEVDEALDLAIEYGRKEPLPENIELAIQHLRAANQLAELRRTLIATQFEMTQPERTPRRGVFKLPTTCRQPTNCAIHGWCQEDPRCDGAAA